MLALPCRTALTSALQPCQSLYLALATLATCIMFLGYTVMRRITLHAMPGAQLPCGYRQSIRTLIYMTLYPPSEISAPVSARITVDLTYIV